MRIKHENFKNEIEVVSYASTQAIELHTELPIENTFDVVVTDDNGDTYGFRVVGDVEEELNKLAI